MKLEGARLYNVQRLSFLVRRGTWAFLIALLLLTLSSCTRAIHARPAFGVTPFTLATATTAPVESTPADIVVPLQQTPPAPLSQLTGRNVEPAAVSPFYRLMDKSVLRSPMATPNPTIMTEPTRDLIAILPTLTPTPVVDSAIDPANTTAISATVAITTILEQPIADSTPDPESATNNDTPVSIPTLIPTATSTAQYLPPSAGPTPDGVARSVRVPILMYHYLSVPPPGADIYRQDLSVAPQLFAAQLDAMQAAGYTTITLYDLVNHLTQGAPLPDKPVVITFDDGYEDNYKNALPLLRERGMVATFFVVTDFIDEERPEYLSWDMAREMRDAGMKIESHGRNHVSLQDKDTDYLIWQALGSMETIEYELGTRPRFVSYPAGQYDRTTADIFASAGYWAGATTVQGATHSSENLFDLHRVRVRGTTSADELLRLLALDW